MYRSNWIYLAMVVVASMGCAPKVSVIKNPSDCDKGFRYYRPKPYLFISPSGDEITETDAKKNTKTTKVKSDEFVNIELQYLPDFSEEYAIDVKNRFGTSNVTLTLEDGWNLTSVNQQLDSQVDENLAAFAEVIKAGGSLIATNDAPEIKTDNLNGAKKKFVVKATNVPIGYYEAVIGKFNNKKQLYGWRYVGFAPFNNCPTALHGGAIGCCESENGAIYGLAFVKGAMVFQSLTDMSCRTDSDFERDPVNFGSIDPSQDNSGAPAPTLTSDDIIKTVNDSAALQGLTGSTSIVSRLEIKDGTAKVLLSQSVDSNTESEIKKLVAKLAGIKADSVSIVIPPPSSAVVIPTPPAPDDDTSSRLNFDSSPYRAVGQ